MRLQSLEERRLLGDATEALPCGYVRTLLTTQRPGKASKLLHERYASSSRRQTHLLTTIGVGNNFRPIADLAAITGGPQHCNSLSTRVSR